MKIAIFGSGPSGLVAAHAALLQGISFDKIDIFSHGKKSRLFGCQYLHAPIDGLPMSDPVTVKYRLEGSPEMYQRKVYGEEKIPRQVSPEELGNEHQAWDIRAAYDYLWTIWGSCIKKAIIASHEIHTPEFKEFLQGYDVIISTIPKTEWCIDPRHDFKTSEIWAIGDAPELGIMVPQRPAEHNMVICNGLHDVGWYRLSNVFGYNTMEWPGRRKPPVEGAVAWRKPISNTCDCWYDLGKIEFIGRYGEWQKGVKVHDVFRRAKRLFTDIQA
jgi:hypothetical protein